MYGWRLRVGLLVPSCNTVMESEFHMYVLQGISVHTARMRIENVISEELLHMVGEADRAAKLLKTARVDIIVFGCTSGSFLEGKEYSKAVEKRIYEATRIPVITTSAAVVDALRSLEIAKLAIATPYPKAINEREVRYFSEHGFEVLAINGLDITRGTEIGELEPREAYRLGMKTMRRANTAEGLFISCTNFRTFEIIEPLTHDIGKPVITSNQASLWMALKLGGVKSFLYGLEK